MAKKNSKPYNKKGNHKYGKQTGTKSMPKDANTMVTGVEDAAKEALKGKPYSNVDAIVSNFIGWWNKDKSYFDNTAGKTAFDIIPGKTISNFPLPAVGTVSAGELSVPGIQVIEFIPTIGTTTTDNDPINRCFWQIYAYICSKGLGARTEFEPADIAISTMGLGALGSYVGAIKRVIETHDMYVPNNYYYPRTLEYALSGPQVDYDELSKHKPNYVARLNNVIDNFNSLRFPNFIDLFDRHYSLSHNIYADSDSVMAQITLYKPKMYYLITDDGMSLEPQNIQWGSWTIDDHIDCLLDAIETWRSNGAFATIQSYMMRAYPESSFLRIEHVDEHAIRTPVVDTVMAWQTENAVIIPYNAIDINSLKVTQNVAKTSLVSNPIISDPTSAGGYYWPLGQQEYILNSFNGDISPEFVMEATRLIAWADYDRDVGPDGGLRIRCGTEIPTSCKIITLSSDGNIEENDVYSHYISTTPSHATIEMLGKLSKFKHHPRIYFYTQTGESSGLYTGDFGDLNVYTVINSAKLASINTAAMNSIYMFSDK